MFSSLLFANTTDYQLTKGIKTAETCLFACTLPNSPYPFEQKKGQIYRKYDFEKH